MLGRGVPQSDMLADVVGGKADGAVSRPMRNGDRSVDIDGRDRPRVTVTDRLPAPRRQSPVVAPGRHDIADHSDLAGGEPHPVLPVEVPDFEAGELHSPVDEVDMIIRGGHHGEGAALLVGVDPASAMRCR